MAEARDLGAISPSRAVVTVEFVDAGMRCCWCDCIAAHALAHSRSDWVCDGCEQDARYVVHGGMGRVAPGILTPGLPQNGA